MTKRTTCDVCEKEITDDQFPVEIDIKFIWLSGLDGDRVITRDFHKGCLKNSRAVKGLEGF